MHSISAKVWLSLAVLLVFLSSCSREGPEPVWEAQSPWGIKESYGGLFPVYITLERPVDSAGSISWKTSCGCARVAYRKQGINSKNQIIADTAYLFWETPPPEKYDSTQTKKDTVVSWKIDTTRYDTVYAIVNNTYKSSPIIIEVKNILPRIKSLIIEGISKPVDSLITIAAHLGDVLTIQLILEKPWKYSFNKDIVPNVEMPPRMGGKPKAEQVNDSLFVYKWEVPNEIISDSSGYLKITETGMSSGERLYKVHLVAYTEEGSVWVASDTVLVKYSPAGTEVARIKGDFNSISDIYVNTKRLFVTDESKNSFSIYNSYGKLLYRDTSLFKLPSGIASDLAGHYVWVADAKNPSATVFEARLRRFSLISDSLVPANLEYEMSGPIQGLSINRFQSDLVWFTTPKRDTVGFTRGIPDSIKFIPYTWKYPFMVSHDQSNGLTWVADRSRIVAIDTSGTVWANIMGFSSVSSVSAGRGNVWVSDTLSRKVYLFKGPFNDSQNINSTISIGTPIDGFIRPISVSAYFAEGGAWVIDKEAGMAVRLDSLGRKIAFGTVSSQSILGKTLQ